MKKNEIEALITEGNKIDEIKLDFYLKEGDAVCFDFDGVIHKYSEGWKDGTIYDDWNPEIIKIMSLLVALEIPVFICSTRVPSQIIEWWNKQGFWREAVEITDDVIFYKDLEHIGVTNRKLPAQLYIDDRAYRYNGQTLKEFMMDNSELSKKE